MYFSEKEFGPKPRTNEIIDEIVWGGLVAIINLRVKDDSFGYRYPKEGDFGVNGCDREAFTLSLKAEVPAISWPLKVDEVPPTLAILDLLEFCHRAVGKPVREIMKPTILSLMMPPLLDTGINYRYRLNFDSEEGQTIFREDVNRIFSINGIAYELEPNGSIVRLAPPILWESLSSSMFNTGDKELDSLLNWARTKYLDPNPIVRRESLEKLWDAWERLKTLESSAKMNTSDKKKISITILLDKASSEPKFRQELEEEAIKLTKIGNTFRIRHSETSQIQLELNENVDYLFHRLFSLIMLLLKRTNRCR